MYSLPRYHQCLSFVPDVLPWHVGPASSLAHLIYFPATHSTGPLSAPQTLSPQALGNSCSFYLEYSFPSTSNDWLILTLQTSAKCQMPQLKCQVLPLPLLFELVPPSYSGLVYFLLAPTIVCDYLAFLVYSLP